MASITCGNCRATHSSAVEVRQCYAGARAQRRVDAVETLTDRHNHPRVTTVQVMSVERVPQGIYTVVRQDDGYTTYRLRQQAEDAGFMPGVTLVERLTGSDNDSDYTTVGHLVGMDFVRVWKRHQASAEAIEADLRIIADDPKAGAQAYALHSGKCGLCGRTLSTPESIARGIGPRCAAKAGW